MNNRVNDSKTVKMPMCQVSRSMLPLRCESKDDLKLAHNKKLCTQNFNFKPLKMSFFYSFLHKIFLQAN